VRHGELSESNQQATRRTRNEQQTGEKQQVIDADPDMGAVLPLIKST